MPGVLERFPAKNTHFTAGRMPEIRRWQAICEEARRTMRVTIERAALLRSLNHVQSVVERRNTIPILSNVLHAGGAGRIAPDRDRSRY